MEKSKDNLTKERIFTVHCVANASYCYHAATKDLNALKILTYVMQYVGAFLT